MSTKDEKESIIPDVIYDKKTDKSYHKGRFFGKGGFAKCYEIKDTKTLEIRAGKIVPKSMMSKTSQREKMGQEISIHRSLHHKNIVGFYGYFDDFFNIYIVLELCRKRSMMELHKRRKALTDCETRYFMKQILDGVNYLHKHRIIHRDLKLGNLFLDDQLQVKIGDFGLATKLEYDGERKKTLCGTPNYIAPEILNKSGHSYEVDVWSIGCIMYTLLVGKPPFETSTLRETYSRIKQVQYKTPATINEQAVTMIVNTLQGNPLKRPNVERLLRDPFIIEGFMPQNLPLSCLTMAPRLDILETYNQPRPILNEMNKNYDSTNIGKRITGNLQNIVPNSPAIRKANYKPEITTIQKSNRDIKKMLITLKDQIGTVISSRPKSHDDASGVEYTDPTAQPFIWVSKWVDYSDKYGFSYQLCDDGVGVMFNDGTRIMMLGNKHNIHYIDRDGSESYYTVLNYPDTLERKMKFVNYFSKYMSDHLLKAGGSVAVKQSDNISRIPYMYQWFRTPNALVMQLTNGSVQINFLDHTKIIMCPLMAAVTYFDTEQNFRTYRFETIQENGCSSGLLKNLQYAYEKLNFLIARQ